ncbi:Glycoside hydrolase family 13 protein [Mycena kentingensis (nom. inval.)]|nr:Glycoside hydrolase family 13 protein [Mycena kentingensis (nom. inval.)]
MDDIPSNTLCSSYPVLLAKSLNCSGAVFQVVLVLLPRHERLPRGYPSRLASPRARRYRRRLGFALNIPGASFVVSRAVSGQRRGSRRAQIVTDRFALPSSASPGTKCDTSARTFCGGAWSGITDHLDYIQAMGFDAIWISPTVLNADGTAYGDGYHGYWSRDLDTLSPRFGSAVDLKALSRALHTRGMYLMLDVVVNHFAAPPTSTATLSGTTSASGSSSGAAAPTGTTQAYAESAAKLTLNYSALSPFSSPSEYHTPCFITYSNQTDVEQCWLGDTLLPLPDVDTEDQQVQARLNAWIKGLVSEYGADGVRIDTVKHVRKDFWRAFSDSAGVFTLGEVLTDNATYAAGYIGSAVDAVLEYPAWYTLVEAFGSTEGNLSTLINTPSLASLATSTTNSSAVTAAFLENHDQRRFPSISTDAALLRNAMVWPFVGDAIPILYYGQEQGYQGGEDPSNREALWLSGYVTDKELVARVKTLNAVRKLAIAGNKDFLASRARWIAQSDISAIMLSKPPLLTLLTNIGSAANASAQPWWTIPDGMYAVNSTLVDVFTCLRVHIGAGGTVRASGGLPMVLIPDTLLDGRGGACPGLAVSESTGVQLGTGGGIGLAFAASVAAAGVVGVV